eukprot:RCo024260
MQKAAEIAETSKQAYLATLAWFRPWLGLLLCLSLYLLGRALLSLGWPLALLSVAVGTPSLVLCILATRTSCTLADSRVQLYTTCAHSLIVMQFALLFPCTSGSSADLPSILPSTLLLVSMEFQDPSLLQLVPAIFTFAVPLAACPAAFLLPVPIGTFLVTTFLLLRRLLPLLQSNATKSSHVDTPSPVPPEKSEDQSQDPLVTSSPSIPSSNAHPSQPQPTNEAFVMVCERLDSLSVEYIAIRQLLVQQAEQKDLVIHELQGKLSELTAKFQAIGIDGSTDLSTPGFTMSPIPFVESDSEALLLQHRSCPLPVSQIRGPLTKIDGSAGTSQSGSRAPNRKSHRGSLGRRCQQWQGPSLERLLLLDAGVSQKMLSPMAMALTSIDVLLSDTTETMKSEERMELLRRVKSCLNVAQVYAHSLTDFLGFRIGEGPRVVVKSVNLRRLLPSILRGFERFLARDVIELLLYIDFSVPTTVKFAGALFQRALSNLLVCAARHAPSPGRVLVALQWDNSCDSLQLRVSDVTSSNAAIVPPAASAESAGGLLISTAAHLLRLMGGQVIHVATAGDCCEDFLCALPAQRLRSMCLVSGKVVLVLDRDALRRQATLALVKYAGAHIHSGSFPDSESCGGPTLSGLPPDFVFVTATDDDCITSIRSWKQQGLCKIFVVIPNHICEVSRTVNFGADGVLASPIDIGELRQCLRVRTDPEAGEEREAEAEDEDGGEETENTVAAPMVLLVEDSVATQKQLMCELASRGLDAVHCARSEVEAVAMAKTTMYSLILVDRCARAEGGAAPPPWPILEVRQSPHHINTPIVALTLTPGHDATCLGPNLRSFAKPVSPEAWDIIAKLARRSLP